MTVVSRHASRWGTRDYRLVQIMKKRIDSFSLLLGGVQGFDVEQEEDADEAWRNNVIQLAKGAPARGRTNTVEGCFGSKVSVETANFETATLPCYLRHLPCLSRPLRSAAAIANCAQDFRPVPE